MDMEDLKNTMSVLNVERNLDCVMAQNKLNKSNFDLWTGLEPTTPESPRKCFNHYATRANVNTTVTVIGQALDTQVSSRNKKGGISGLINLITM